MTDIRPKTITITGLDTSESDNCHDCSC